MSKLTCKQIEAAMHRKGFISFEMYPVGQHFQFKATLRHSTETWDVNTRHLRLKSFDEWIAYATRFCNGVGRTKIVTSLCGAVDREGNHKLVRIPVNTPLCCDPSSE